MAEATNRYLEAFNQFAQGTGSRKERAREFAVDTMTRLFDEHLDARDQAESLLNAAGTLAAVPGAVKSLRDVGKKVIGKFADKGGRPADFRPNRVGEPADESGVEMQPRTNLPKSSRVTNIDEPASGGGDEFGESSRSLGPQEGMSEDPVDFSRSGIDTDTGNFTMDTGRVRFASQAGARTAQTAESADAGFSETASAARQAATSAGRLVGRLGSNIANVTGKAAETISEGARAAGNVLTTASESVSNAASAAGDVVGSAARSIIGDAAVDATVDTLGTVAAGLSEVAAPVSLLVLTGLGIFDLVKSLTNKPVDQKTSLNAPVNRARAAIVAPSTDATLQQTSGSAAF